MSYKKYKIKSAKDILRRFRLPRFNKTVKFFNVMSKSSNNSKINCLFQCFNVILAGALIYLILPDWFEHKISLFNEFEWLFLPIGRIVATFSSYLIFKGLSGFLNFSLSDLFETVLVVTVSITIGLAICVVLLLNNLFFSFIGRFKQDLILWKTSK